MCFGRKSSLIAGSQCHSKPGRAAVLVIIVSRDSAIGLPLFILPQANVTGQLPHGQARADNQAQDKSDRTSVKDVSGDKDRCEV